MNKNSQRSRRWRDTDGKGTCRTIRMWRNTLSKNASPMVLSEGQGIAKTVRLSKVSLRDVVQGR
jgi:hypothetical protein